MSRLVQFITILLVCLARASDAVGAELASIKQSNWVSSLAFIPDGRLAAGSPDGTVRLVHPDTRQSTQVLKGHADIVSALAVSPYGKMLVSGSYDQTAKLWNLDSGQLIRTLDGHRGAVLAVAFSADGNLFASAGIDSLIQLWDVRAGKLRRTLRGHKSWVNSIEFTPSGALVSGSSDGTVKFWNCQAGKVTDTWDVSSTEIRSIASSSDARTIFAGLRYGKILILRKGRGAQSLEAHTGDAWCAKMLRDGIFISGGGDWKRPGQVKIWDSTTGRLLQTFNHSGEVLCLATSSNGQRVAAGGGDGVIKIWDIP